MTAIRAGSLDRRITIQGQGPQVDDGMGVKEGGWFDLATRWAELAPLSGAESVAAAELAATETLKFRVRRDGVTAALDPKLHRIGYQGRDYDLTGKQEVGKQGFDLLVIGRADSGLAPPVPAQD